MWISRELNLIWRFFSLTPLQRITWPSLERDRELCLVKGKSEVSRDEAGVEVGSDSASPEVPRGRWNDFSPLQEDEETLADSPIRQMSPGKYWPVHASASSS